MLIAILAFIVALPIGFILVLLFRGYDAKLENYYKETMVEVVRTSGYSPESTFEVPKEIIVDSHRAYSPLRVFLKVQIAKMLGKEIPEVFVVFGTLSDAEQKAFLIQKAFSSVVSRLLDLDFIESLIHYLAHKYASENLKIEEEIRAILRKNFEHSAYRDYMLKLDSLEYSVDVVLNPPPLEKPLLTNIILPMVKEQERRLISLSADVAEMETWKYFFMRIIEEFCAKKSAVLFVGTRPFPEYMDLLLQGLDDFGSVVVSARGTNVTYMKNMIRYCCELEKSKPIKDRVLTSCERKDIAGMWKFPEEEFVSCHWVILTST